MEQVSIRELRHHGGDVVDRVAAGEALMVTRAGTPVAELRPVAPAGLEAGALVRRWRAVPLLDPAVLRRDVQALVDQRL